ncbi:MAG: GntR family transcriptional regulator [Chloroflexota bacterium]|nr:GntR family transcriptional regulator [Chloroflexota bacterium]
MPERIRRRPQKRLASGPRTPNAEAERRDRAAAARERSLVDQVAEQVTARIIDGTFRPGQVLSEQAMGQELGVSRTPVREALARLRHEGLITIGPGRSPVVSDLTEREVREIYLVRSHMSGLVSRLAAERATPGQIGELRRLAEALGSAAQAQDVASFFKSNSEFHRLANKIADNSVVTSLIASLGLRVLRLRYLSIGLPGRMETSAHLHVELVDAFERHDGAAAEQISRQIIDGACQAILYYYLGVRQPKDLAVLKGEVPLLFAELGAS